MKLNGYDDPAYILYLIRERKANSWEELCAHFDFSPKGRHTGHDYLEHSLKLLDDAQLITIEGKFASLTVTELLAKTQRALGISFKQLAYTDSEYRMVVSPLFGEPNTQSAHDIFVIMPFKEEMRAVYQDHLRKIASKLKRSIARADDFFGAHQVMEDVWSALYSSKVIVADCTGKNPNVFYEMGIAHSIGKPVILITQNSDDVPFDLRHIRYLEYEFTPKGMKLFEKQIGKTISYILEGLDAA